MKFFFSDERVRAVDFASSNPRARVRVFKGHDNCKLVYAKFTICRGTSSAVVVDVFQSEFVSVCTSNFT